jgi:hypothetical protein
MGASADLEAIGAPSIFKLIRKAAALAMCFPCHFVIFFLFVFLIAQTQEAAVDDWRTSIIFYFYASIFFHFFPCCTNTGRGSGRLAYQHYFLFLCKYFFSFFSLLHKHRTRQWTTGVPALFFIFIQVFFFIFFSCCTNTGRGSGRLSWLSAVRC